MLLAAVAAGVGIALGKGGILAGDRGSARPAGETLAPHGGRSADQETSGGVDPTEPAATTRAEQAPIEPPSKIVLILVDTLRADHLPFYGYEQNTAAFLSELASRSVVFESAFSTSSWTAPAAASLFTGLYPEHHGVVTGRQATEKIRDKLRSAITLNRIPAAVETLAEVMQRAGYRTYGVADNYNVCAQMGFDQGFDRFVSQGNWYRGASFISGVLRGWHGEMSRSAPYFLYLHYLDPHVPYHKRAHWYRGPEPPPETLRPALTDNSEAQVRSVKARYDSEIGYVDANIRLMFRLFGWDRDTLLIFTSDHGEEFWDHQGLGHDKTLYDEVLRIPLLIYDSSGRLRPRRVSTPVSLVDILPTLAEYLGLPPVGGHQGVSLLSLLEGAEDPRWSGRDLYAHLDRQFFSPWGPDNRLVGDGHEHYTTRAVVRRDWKLIVDSRGASRLFRRPDDPAELENLFDDLPDIAAGLSESLQSFSEQPKLFRQESFEEELSAEEVERLRSLGYVQ